MNERIADLIVHDDYDLAVALASALRDARAAGDVPWERTLAATLAQVSHVLAQTVDPAEEAMPAITHLNGRPDAEAIRVLLRR
jgi:hypothetical protein